MATSDFLSDTIEIPPVRVQPAGAEAEDDAPRPLRKVTSDDVFTVVGALVGSFALTWLLYYDVLPLNGLLGFVISWYVGFLVMYAGVTALAHPRPVVVDRLMGALVTGVALLVAFVVVTVVVYTVWRGHLALTHWNFYTQPASAGSLTGPFTKGGISNAIIGTLIQVSMAVVVSVPLGVGTAIYMTEVGGGFAKVVRTVVEAMTAVPDLLAGLFVYVVLILELGRSRNGLAVAIAISVTMTPIVARSAEVALRVVPGGLREAGLALGSSHWQTVRRIVLPTARPGLATAVILAVARGIGESAPLIIVSGFTTFWNANPFDRQTMNSLPLYVYNGVRSGQPNEITRAYGAAIVLLGFVFVLFAVTRLLARRRVGSR
jgi:phosphate transport system permease protein